MTQRPPWPPPGPPTPPLTTKKVGAIAAWPPLPPPPMLEVTSLDISYHRLVTLQRVAIFYPQTSKKGTPHVFWAGCSTLRRGWRINHTRLTLNQYVRYSSSITTINLSPVHVVYKQWWCKLRTIGKAGACSVWDFRRGAVCRGACPSLRLSGRPYLEYTKSPGGIFPPPPPGF